MPLFVVVVRSGFKQIYSISFLWYPTVALCVALVVGILVSCLTGQLPLMMMLKTISHLYKEPFNDNVMPYLWQKYMFAYIYIFLCIEQTSIAYKRILLFAYFINTSILRMNQKLFDEQFFNNAIGWTKKPTSPRFVYPTAAKFCCCLPYKARRGCDRLFTYVSTQAKEEKRIFCYYRVTTLLLLKTVLA